MADYYTNLSFEFTATPEEAKNLEALVNTDWDADPRPEHFDKFFTDDDWVHFGVYSDIDPKTGHVVIYNDESPNLEALPILIQFACPSILPFGFEWSKPRFDAFSGGCVAIFADHIVYKNTSTILDELLNR